MKINLTVRRSKEWLSGQRLARGENVNETVMIEVNPREQSEATRKFLLACNWSSEYKDHARFYYDREYNWVYAGVADGYGNDMLQYDGDAMTAAEIDQAFVEMRARLDARRQKWEAEKLANEARKAAEAEAAAEKKRKLAEARELLSGELSALTKKVDAAQTDRGTLGRFLSHVPQDALRGALKLYTAAIGDDALSECQEKVENASPYTVFEDEDDEDIDE